MLKGLVSMQSCQDKSRLRKWRVVTLEAPCTLPNISSTIKCTTVRNRGYKVLDSALAVSIVFDYSTLLTLCQYIFEGRHENRENQ